jgi:hypothetical protein
MTVLARPQAPAVTWLSTLLAAALASVAVSDAVVPLAAGGAVIALTLLRAPLSVRLLTALAMVPVALLDSSPVWSWAFGATALGLACGLFPRESETVDVNGDLQRHLAWCRRREEPAHMLVVPLNGTTDAGLSELLESFRITDSVTLGRGAGGSELYALLDAHGLVRQGLERRLAGRLGDHELGWATFPDDGITLQTLIEHARKTMQEGERPEGQAAAEGSLVEAQFDPPPRAPSLEHATGRS